MIIFFNRGSELASIRNPRQKIFVTIPVRVTIYDNIKHKPFNDYEGINTSLNFLSTHLNSFSFPSID